MKEKHLTACTLDCPDGCSLLVETEAGLIRKIRGNPDHPYTDGYCCPKIRRFPRRLGSPSRLKTPLLKGDQGWESISWDEALSLCAEKIDGFRREPASILHLRGGGSKGVIKFAEDYFFARLGASRVIPHGVCDSTGIEASIDDFGALRMNDPLDLLNARGIVVWGKGLGVSSIHMGGLVARARRRGAAVLSISPRAGENRRFSDRTVRLKPGTDRFLALAAAKVFLGRYGVLPGIEERSLGLERFKRLVEGHELRALSESCDVPVEEIERLAEFYRLHRPCATILGIGLQRYPHGAESVRAINALAFVTGNIGLSGGGAYYSVPSGENLNLGWVKSEGYRRSFPVASIGRSIMEAENPPIRMVWVSMWNPVNQTPESLVLSQALGDTDFVVVVDPFLTDTADAADLVLPCSMMFEEEDLVGSWGHFYVNYAGRVVGPPPGVRSDLEILTDLGHRLDPPIRLESPDFYMQRSLESPFLDTTLEELRQRGTVRARRPFIAFEGGRFSHPDGKFRFLTEISPREPADSAYPLILLTLIRKEFLHSQILPEEHESLFPEVSVAPSTLADLGIKEGDHGRIVSTLGSMRVRFKSDAGLHPSAVVVGRGPWLKYGWGINRLVEGRFTDRPDGVAFYGQRVRVEGGPPFRDGSP
ncbi:MAG: molybdopterin-dependent oxidoreductase [Deltaproteobacteria bacterium]|nr:molybdopterin-dependent oxidoreductase [Deltaproteobacteria bacterium]MBW2120668.1 molybdopterin-dependent oxidoreductase [Deltaproteobacteria bacterium]